MSVLRERWRPSCLCIPKPSKRPNERIEGKVETFMLVYTETIKEAE